MRGQSDQALRASLRKVYGSVRAMSEAELRRRLLAIPELFYYADELIDEASRRGILRPAAAAEHSDWLEIAGETGNLDAWP
jgi:hypothetical protein